MKFKKIIDQTHKGFAGIMLIVTSMISMFAFVTTSYLSLYSNIMSQVDNMASLASIEILMQYKTNRPIDAYNFKRNVGSMLSNKVEFANNKGRNYEPVVKEISSDCVKIDFPEMLLTNTNIIIKPHDQESCVVK